MSVDQFDGTRITIGDREISYVAPNGVGDGPGEVVLLLHGASADSSVWDDVTPLIAAGHRPIVPDNPAHGRSDGPPVETVDEGVELYKAFHDALGLDRMVIVGHSMGGAMAQRYYALHPDDVVGLGLISTSASFNMPDELVQSWLADPDSYRAMERESIFSPQASDEVREAFLKIRDSLPPEAQRADLLACAAWNNPDTQEIAVPTLAMTADGDYPGLPEQAAAWAERLPDCTLVTIPAAGHMLVFEQSELTGRAIVDWLDSL